jgi:hypothetical protein
MCRCPALVPHRSRERLADVQALTDCFLEPREQAAAAVHRDGDRGVSEPFLDRERVSALADCEGGARMAQLVEHEPVKPCPGYDWVECGSCGAGWQVPHYAESVG